MTIPTLRNFIREIAPELADIGLRLEHRTGSPVGGLFVPGCIAETGRPTVILNVADASEDAILAALTHELAHAATDRNQGQIAPPATAEGIVLRREVARRAMDGILPEPQTPYGQHADGFIRALCHLWVRSDALGYRFLAQDLFPHGHYQLSDLFAYLQAIGDEPRRMTQLTLDEILQIDPPDDFSELWREDVVAANPEQTELVTMNIFERLRKQESFKAATLHDLARGIAAGKDVSPDTVLQVLADCGRTAEELEALTAEYADRQRKREIIQQADKSNAKELGQIESRMAALNEKLERAQAEYADTMAPLRERARQIRDTQSAADSARSELQNGNEHPDEALRQKYQAAHDRRNHLETQTRELRALVESNRREQENAEHDIKRRQIHRIPLRGYASAGFLDVEGDEDRRIIENAEACKARATRYATTLASVEKELRAAERECAEIDAQVAAC